MDDLLQDIKNALPSVLDTSDSVQRVERTLRTSLLAIQDAKDDDKCLLLLKAGILYVVAEIMSLFSRSMPVIYTNSILDLLLQTITAASEHGSKCNSFVVLEVTSPYLDIIWNDKFPFLARLEVLKSLNTIFESAAPSVTEKFLKTDKCMSKLGSLLQLVRDIGDYEFQAGVMEFLFRAVPRKSRQMFAQSFIKNSETRKEYLKIKDSSFEVDCRKFLNRLNSSLPSERRVISLPCQDVKLGSFQLQKPTDEGYNDFWLDCNMGSKRLVIFCEHSQLSSQRSADDDFWDALSVAQSDIHKFKCWEENGMKRASVWLKTSAACIQHLAQIGEDPVMYLTVDRKYDLSEALVQTLCQKKVSDADSKVHVTKEMSEEPLGSQQEIYVCLTVNDSMERETTECGSQASQQLRIHHMGDTRQQKVSVPTEVMVTPASTVSLRSFEACVGVGRGAATHSQLEAVQDQAEAIQKEIDKEAANSQVASGSRHVETPHTLKPEPTNLHVPSHTPKSRATHVQSTSLHSTKSKNGSTQDSAHTPKCRVTRSRNKVKTSVVTFEEVTKKDKGKSDGQKKKMSDPTKDTEGTSDTNVQEQPKSVSDTIISNTSDKESQKKGRRPRHRHAKKTRASTERPQADSNTIGEGEESPPDTVIPDSLPAYSQADREPRSRSAPDNRVPTGRPSAEPDLTHTGQPKGQTNKMCATGNGTTQLDVTPTGCVISRADSKDLPPSIDEFKGSRHKRCLSGLVKSQCNHSASSVYESASGEKSEKCQQSSVDSQKAATELERLKKSGHIEDRQTSSTHEESLSGQMCKKHPQSAADNNKTAKDKETKSANREDMQALSLTGEFFQASNTTSIKTVVNDARRKTLRPREVPALAGLISNRKPISERSEISRMPSFTELTPKHTSKSENMCTQSISGTTTKHTTEVGQTKAGTSSSMSRISNSTSEKKDTLTSANEKECLSTPKPHFREDPAAVSLDNSPEIIPQNEQDSVLRQHTSRNQTSVHIKSDQKKRGDCVSSREDEVDMICCTVEHTRPNKQTMPGLCKARGQAGSKLQSKKNGKVCGHSSVDVGDGDDDRGTSNYSLVIESETPPHEPMFPSQIGVAEKAPVSSDDDNAAYYRFETEPVSPSPPSLRQQKSHDVGTRCKKMPVSIDEGVGSIVHATNTKCRPLPESPPADLGKQAKSLDNRKRSTFKQLHVSDNNGIEDDFRFSIETDDDLSDGNLKLCESDHNPNKHQLTKMHKSLKVSRKKSFDNSVCQIAKTDSGGMKLRKRVPKSYREDALDDISEEPLQESNRHDIADKSLQYTNQKFVFSQAQKKVSHEKSHLVHKTFTMSVSSAIKQRSKAERYGSDPYDFECESVSSYGQNHNKQNQKRSKAKCNSISSLSKLSKERSQAKEAVFTWDRITGSLEKSPQDRSLSHTMSSQSKGYSYLLQDAARDKTIVCYESPPADNSVEKRSPSPSCRDQTSFMLFCSQTKQSKLGSHIQDKVSPRVSSQEWSPRPKRSKRIRLGKMSPVWTSGKKRTTCRSSRTHATPRKEYSFTELDNTVSVGKSEVSWITRHKSDRGGDQPKATKTYKRNHTESALSPTSSLSLAFSWHRPKWPELDSIEVSPKPSAVTSKSCKKKMYSPLDVTIVTPTIPTSDKLSKSSARSMTSSKSMTKGRPKTPANTGAQSYKPIHSLAGCGVGDASLSDLEDDEVVTLSQESSQAKSHTGDEPPWTGISKKNSSTLLALMRQAAESSPLHTSQSPSQLLPKKSAFLKRGCKKTGKSLSNQELEEDCDGEIFPFEQGLLSGPSSIIKPSTAELKRRYVMSDDSGSDGEEERHSSKRACLVPRMLFPSGPNDSGDFSETKTSRTQAESISTDSEVTIQPLPSQPLASKSKTPKFHPWGMMTGIGDGSEVPLDLAAATEISGSTVASLSQADVDLCIDEEESDIGVGGVSSMLKGFGTDLQKQMKTKERQIQALSKDALKLSSKHIHQLWMAEKNKRDEVLKEFRESIVSELLALEKDVTALCELEKRAEASYFQQVKAFHDYREQHGNRVQSLKSQHEAFRSKSEQATAQSKKTKKSMETQLRRDMKTLESKFLLDMQEQQLRNVKQTLHKLFY